MTELNAAVVAELWKHAKTKQTPKDPFLQSVLRFMLLHENFHPMWEKIAADPTISLVVDGENVVLHVAMDAAAENAITTDRPEGIRELFEGLEARGVERGQAFHAISSAMRDEYLVAGEAGEPLDLVRFYARAKDYVKRMSPTERGADVEP